MRKSEARGLVREPAHGAMEEVKDHLCGIGEGADKLIVLGSDGQLSDGHDLGIGIIQKRKELHHAKAPDLGQFIPTLIKQIPLMKYGSFHKGEGRKRERGFLDYNYSILMTAYP